MSFDFPSSPTVGQKFSPVAGTTYTWNGYGWTSGANTWSIAVQTFAANGTYTPRAGMQFCMLEVVGGGGGGGAAWPDTNYAFRGSGGGSGGYSRKLVTAAQIGASQTVIVGTGGAAGVSLTPNGGSQYAGNGGASSVGSLCTANGGLGGAQADATWSQIKGGAGGAPGTGDLAAGGSAGGGGAYNNTSTNPAVDNIGHGGASYFGGGGLAANQSNENGGPGTAPGAGGAGGGTYGGSTYSNGGAGAAGIVVITEYIFSSGGAVPGSPQVASQNLVNGKIVESHAANVATFALKTRAGADPSAADPVSVALPDGSVLTITAPFSFSTGSATFGMIANTPHRLWFAIGSNAGAPVLMARLCSAASVSGFNVSGNIVGFDSRGVTNTAVVGNSAYITYAASALSNIPYKIVAFADYESGLATPGTWAVSPTRITQVGPQTPLPGSVISIRQAGPFGQSSNATAGFVDTNTVISGALSSPMNAFHVRMVSNVYISASNMNVIIGRDNNSIRSFEQQIIGGPDTSIMIEMLDFPQTTASKTYITAIHNSDNSSIQYLPGNSSSGLMTLTELMG